MNTCIFIAVDDDPTVLADIATTLQSIPAVTRVETFTSASDALAHVRHDGPADIILCDIRMPDISGLEAASLLAGYCRLFALLTGHPEYTLEAYRRGADAYLLKPLETVDVERLLGKLVQRGAATPPPFRLAFDRLLVYNGEDKLYYPVPLVEITKILLSGNYVFVYAPDLVSPTKLSLTKAAEYLAPTGLFIQVNPTALIAKLAITRIGPDIVYLGSETFKVTEHYRAGFRRFVKGNQFGKGGLS